jgi:hypothetical protein
VLLKKIDYNDMFNRSRIGVVRDILQIVAKNGFYKKQHLYVTFATRHPEVDISDILFEDFEDEMTIVLQHEFWDLEVGDHGFSVSLAFEHDDETLYIPFSSIISVSDPTENFNMELVPNFAIVVEDNENKLKPDLNNVISLDKFRRRD